MSEEESRRKIREEIKGIFDRKKREFTPGETNIQYAGDVIDEKEIVAIVDSVLDGWFGLGKHGAAFSRDLSKFIGTKHTVLTNSGSSANLLAVSALSAKTFQNRLMPGDEAIIPAGAVFPTTFNPLIQNNLRPVLVDIGLGTYNTTPEMIKSAITEKTRLIMLPHTLGNPNQMDDIMQIAKEHNLFVIEDTCDALGSKYNGQMCGTFGDMGTSSFYPAHHMTMGEGGVVFTDNAQLRKILKSIRDWGRDCHCEWDQKSPDGTCEKRIGFEVDGIEYDHRYVYSNIGYNLKPLDLQAAMGRQQLKKLTEFNKIRKMNFKLLYDGVSKYEKFFILPKSVSNADPVWFAFPLTIKDNVPFRRRDITKFLEEKKIQTRVLFSGNIVRQPAYKNINYNISGELKNSDKVMKDSFFVGVYPGIDEKRIEYVLQMFEKFLKKY